jgi:hypothetical protein
MPVEGAQVGEAEREGDLAEQRLMARPLAAQALPEPELLRIARDAWYR